MKHTTLRNVFSDAAGRYIDTTLEATSSGGGPGTTDIDPTIYSLGVGFKF